MAAAIWSCPVATMGQFPAASLARFFRNHGLLDLGGRPVWRTVTGGSHSYVKRMLRDLPGAVRTGCGVVGIRRDSRGVTLKLADGSEQVFDQVVLATHADQALGLLSDPTSLERTLLTRFGYQTNRAVLHSDPELMPRNRRVWSSWNYLAQSGRRNVDTDRVSVTYWMNLLQGLDTERPLFVSLNPLREPQPATVIAEMSYEHPVFNHAAVAAQPRLAELQGRQRTWFCGSYFGYGFHEDALVSALAVAQAFGVAPPWLAPAAAAAPAARGALLPGLQGA
jgi:predicted NAD/FAD-binding protein